MEWVITFVSIVVTFITLVAGVVTIIWFIRDVRKENSKILKAIEEGQRKGFEKLDAGLEKLGQILEKQGEMLKAINEGQVKQTEILARINSKLK